jgi:hypothetical protein
MADFCAACVVEMFGPDVPRESNDFVGWLTGRTTLPRAWGLCESCGTHLFDNGGERLCGDHPTPGAVSPEGGMGPCTACLGIRELAEHQRNP